jgi:molybdopterin/thiamine biosynthesis adenylyltransferase
LCIAIESNARVSESSKTMHLIAPILGGLGIKGYTIVDDAKVTTKDLGNNFFVEEQSLGESRAKVTSALLQELNELVQGNFLEEVCFGQSQRERERERE